MHEVLVNRLGGLSLPRKSVVRLTDRPDMTLDVYRGRKTTNQQINLYQITLEELSSGLSLWIKYTVIFTSSFSNGETDIFLFYYYYYYIISIVVTTNNPF